MIPVNVNLKDYSTFMENAYLTATKDTFTLMRLRTFLLYADVLKENTGNGMPLTTKLVPVLVMKEKPTLLILPTLIIPRILLILLILMTTLMMLTNAA